MGDDDDRSGMDGLVCEVAAGSTEAELKFVVWL